MKHGQDFDGLAVDRVRYDIWRPWNDEFARIWDSARAAALRQAGEAVTDLWIAAAILPAARES
jgi:hypothetical protein